MLAVIAAIGSLATSCKKEEKQKDGFSPKEVLGTTYIDEDTQVPPDSIQEKYNGIAASNPTAPTVSFARWTWSGYWGGAFYSYGCQCTQVWYDATYRYAGSDFQYHTGAWMWTRKPAEWCAGLSEPSSCGPYHSCCFKNVFVSK